jgi:hypothetical protein
MIICGDREWNDLETMALILDKFPRHIKIVHGDCRGADKMAALVCQELGFTDIVPYPAQWDKYQRAAGPIRNREMYKKEQPQLVIAFHKNIDESTGTKDMLNVASSDGCPTIIFK